VWTDPWTWVGTTCAIAFLLLAGQVSERAAFAFDDGFTAFVQGLPVPPEAWLLLTAAGGTFLVLAGAGIVIALIFARRIREAIIYGVAIVGASIWTHVVKVHVGRMRPPDAALVPAPGFSFPSGHTLNSTVIYGLVALLIWRTGLPAWARLLGAVGLAALVLLIGLSRIALGVHYPTDVVGGWLAGVAIVAAVAVLTSRASGTVPEGPVDLGERDAAIERGEDALRGDGGGGAQEAGPCRPGEGATHADPADSDVGESCHGTEPAAGEDVDR